MTLAQELLKAHSPGNRFAYFPSTTKWNNEVLPPLKDLDLKGHGHLYLHIPFCQSLCTFCGCNIKIDNNQEEHLLYVETLIKEFHLKDPEGTSKNSVKALTLGGGSPNALNLLALEKLVVFLKTTFTHLQEVLIEVDPNTLSKEQVDLFKEVAPQEDFIRFTMGVQDFSQAVCENVNRHQKVENIFRAFEFIGTNCEKGIDLIWGLPLQEESSMAHWENHLKGLNPDWVNFYPLAKVPWLLPYQEAYGNYEVPNLEKKYLIFEKGHGLLENLGLYHFGFGHYLNKKSSLYGAFKNKSLFRSVSGLYLKRHQFSLALGVGAIGHCTNFHFQNERVLEKYKFNILEKADASPAKTHQINNREREFQMRLDEVLYTNKLPHELAAKLPSSWYIQETQEIAPKGRLFIKNILQILEKEHFS